MDIVKPKGEWKKNLIQKWRSFGNSMKSPKIVVKYLTRSKTWHSTTNSRSISAGGANRINCPGGCFSVYVGPEKQRFVLKMEFANHPLFKVLLEDAELEYGFNSDGPILLPCDVDLFYKVLAEMVNAGDEIASPTCTPMILCSPVNRGYRLVSPSRFLKLNQ